MVGGDGHHGKQKKQSRHSGCSVQTSLQRQGAPIPQLLGVPATNGQSYIPHPELLLASGDFLAQGYVSPRVQLRRNVWLTWGYKGASPSSLWNTLRATPAWELLRALAEALLAAMLDSSVPLCLALPSHFLIAVCSMSTLQEPSVRDLLQETQSKIVE